MLVVNLLGKYYSPSNVLVIFPWGIYIPFPSTSVANASLDLSQPRQGFPWVSFLISSFSASPRFADRIEQEFSPWYMVQYKDLYFGQTEERVTIKMERRQGKKKQIPSWAAWCLTQTVLVVDVRPDWHSNEPFPPGGGSGCREEEIHYLCGISMSLLPPYGFGHY